MPDTAGTNPDGDALTYKWFFYSDAASGFPGQPVFQGPPVVVGGGGNPSDGGIPLARVVLDREDGPVTKATLRTPGAAHVIAVVEDKETPTLTS